MNVAQEKALRESHAELLAALKNAYAWFITNHQIQGGDPQRTDFNFCDPGDGDDCDACNGLIHPFKETIEKAELL